MIEIPGNTKDHRTLPRLPHISLVERDRRWQRVRRKMDERGLDCLAVVVIGHSSDMSNMAYLSSIHFPGAGGALLVFPRNHEPTVHMGGNLANLEMWRHTQEWVKEIRPAPQPLSWPRATMDRLRELGLSKSRVGVVNQADAPGVDCSLAEFFAHRARDIMPDVAWEDAGGLIEEVRLIKSDEEIALMQKATEIGDQAILKTAEFAKAGIPSRAVYARLYASLVECGSEHPFILWDAGPSPVHGVWVPDGHILEPGHIILNEYSAYYYLYQSQFQRPMAVGFVPDTYKRLFDAARASYERGFETLKPGNTFGNVVQAMAEPVLAAGFITVTPHFHGMGLSLERPIAFSQKRRSLYQDLDTARWHQFQNDMEQLAVQPGMTITFEPNAVTPDQKQGVHVGDTLVVREKGAERMSKLPLEWFIV